MAATFNDKNLFIFLKGKKGDKGDTGAKLVRQTLKGVDENGNNIYEQLFDDGTVAEFIAPKGEKGDANITTDTELSDTSTNPVQNKVVTAKLQKLEQILGDVDSSLDSIIELQNGLIILPQAESVEF